MYPQIIYIKQYVPKRNVPQYKFYPLHAKCISHHKMYIPSQDVYPITKCISHHKMYSLQIVSTSHVISQNKMYSIKKYILHKMYHRSLNVSTPDLIYITQNVLHPKMYCIPKCILYKMYPSIKCILSRLYIYIYITQDFFITKCIPALHVFTPYIIYTTQNVSHHKMYSLQNVSTQDFKYMQDKIYCITKYIASQNVLHHKMCSLENVSTPDLIYVKMYCIKKVFITK